MNLYMTRTKTGVSKDIEVETDVVVYTGDATCMNLDETSHWEIVWRIERCSLSHTFTTS